MHVPVGPLKKGASGASALIDKEISFHAFLSCALYSNYNPFYAPTASIRPPITPFDNETYLAKHLAYPICPYNVQKMWEVDPETKTKVPLLPPTNISLS